MGLKVTTNPAVDSVSGSELDFGEIGIVTEGQLLGVPLLKAYGPTLVHLQNPRLTYSGSSIPAFRVRRLKPGESVLLEVT